MRFLWHLVWKIALDNTDEHLQMLRSCLFAVAARFNNENADIDCSLAEPEQIIKLWDTMVRKGPNTPLRPRRRSRVMTMPDRVAVVPTELLRSLAAQAPVQAGATHSKGDTYPEVSPDFDPEDFFEWCPENSPEEYKEFFCRDSDADRQDADDNHYVMDGCFWSERKHSGDRRKTEFIPWQELWTPLLLGRCGGVHIGDIPRTLTKLAGKPYPNQIWEQDEAIFEGVDFVDHDDESLEDELETDESETETSEEVQVDEVLLPFSAL